MKKPKPISLASEDAGEPQAPPALSNLPRAPRPIGLPSEPDPILVQAASPAPSKNPRSIGLPQIPDAPITNRSSTPGRAISLSGCNDKYDNLVREAVNADATMQQYTMRLKPRFMTLEKCTDDDVLDWGERNLVELQSATSKKAALAARISQINPTNWIEKTAEASAKPPSLFGKLFSSNETPQYYQTRLAGVRTELLDTMKELKTVYEEVFPDAEDLRMDIVALQTFNVHNQGTLDAIIVDGRIRTLVAAQQTVVMVLQAIEQFRSNCATNIQTIDQLLRVTIPNWLLATSQQR